MRPMVGIIVGALIGYCILVNGIRLRRSDKQNNAKVILFIRFIGTIFVIIGTAIFLGLLLIVTLTSAVHH